MFGFDFPFRWNAYTHRRAFAADAANIVHVSDTVCDCAIDIFMSSTESFPLKQKTAPATIRIDNSTCSNASFNV